MRAQEVGLTRLAATPAVSTISITTTTVPFTPSSLITDPPVRFATNTGANSVVFDLTTPLSPVSGASVAWPTGVGATVVDNNILWTCQALTVGTPSADWVTNNPYTTGAVISVASVGYDYQASIYSYPYTATCETAGSVGSLTANTSGNVSPLSSVAGLTGATISGWLSGGTDTETDASLCDRYLVKVNFTPFGGNFADYALVLLGVNPVVSMSGNLSNPTVLNFLTGIGAVQIYPTWNQGGTVLISVVDDTFLPLIGDKAPDLAGIQAAIDPGVTGTGLGMAPIGASVTITTATPLSLAFAATITSSDHVSATTACTTAIQNYLASLSTQWGTSKTYVITSYSLTVIAAKIITAMIDSSPVVSNVTDLEITGGISGATEPTWPDSGNVNDYNLTWKNMGATANSESTWVASSGYSTGAVLNKTVSGTRYAFVVQPDIILIESGTESSNLQQIPSFGSLTPSWG
jgi:uncharacterized phage protein gp47/JayE